MGRRPPHAPPRPRLLAKISSTTKADTQFVVALFDETAVTKGHGPVDVSIYLCLVVLGPKQGNWLRATKSSSARLAWDHRRTRCRVFWEPLTYPWRERAKAKLLEGRVEAAHVGCCVFCVLCVVLCLLAWLLFYYFLFFSLPTGRNRSVQSTNKQTLLHCK
jgi:hypothetical protein